MSIYTCPLCLKDKQDDDSPCQEDGLCSECWEQIHTDDTRHVACRFDSQVMNNEPGSNVTEAGAVRMVLRFDPKCDESFRLEGLRPDEYLEYIRQFYK